MSFAMALTKRQTVCILNPTVLHDGGFGLSSSGFLSFRCLGLCHQAPRVMMAVSAARGKAFHTAASHGGAIAGLPVS